jgi:mannose-6-phosphate isomerase-like protein (cupin superfamily)
MADFVLREWTLAPYPGDQAPPHIHHRSDEAFIVLDGELEVLVDAERRILTAGESVLVPAGTIHTFATRGPVGSRIIVVMTPEIDELIAALHNPEPGVAKDTIWARHNASIAITA